MNMMGMKLPLAQPIATASYLQSIVSIATTFAASTLRRMTYVAVKTPATHGLNIAT
jgi:hypothetical protein